MTIKNLQEGKIAELIKIRTSDHQLYSYRPKDFISYLVNDEWRITFTYLDEAGCELHLKRKGIKTFSDLSTVENCLRKIGVTEFKVIL
jgi:hypothetical protein